MMADVLLMVMRWACYILFQRIIIISCCSDQSDAAYYTDEHL